MKYVVDQINEQVCVLESLDDGNILEVLLDVLPDNIREGSILILNNDVFTVLVSEEVKRKESLRERMNRLKKNNE